MASCELGTLSTFCKRAPALYACDLKAVSPNFMRIWASVFAFCEATQQILQIKALALIDHTVAETWRRVWGDGKIFRGRRFLNDGSSGKNVHFHKQNF